MNVNSIIYTNTARCRDCYRCVRECPVNAIKIEDDQASVDIDKCILCGTCLRECPQNAKAYRSDVGKVKRLLRESVPVIVTIAPSFAAFYSNEEIEKLPSVFKALGFSYITHTAEGAYFIAREARHKLDAENSKPLLATACPAFVNLVEKYNSQFTDNLMPLTSPMVAHAKMLKERYGENSKIVFVGPCIAKKGEAEREENRKFVDAVLTFDELNEWISEEEINFDDMSVAAFDGAAIKNSALFPLVGGLTKTAELNSDLLAESTLSVSGIDEIKEAFNFIEKNNRVKLVEPLVCKYGCINGPGVTCSSDLFTRRNKIMDYVQKAGANNEPENCLVELKSLYSDKNVLTQYNFKEEEINAVLARTGKLEVSDQLNCGACGYQTCREKAVAVLAGMAEIEMCMPFMRKQAEQRTDKILESSPNGIVILDSQLNILTMNPSFKRFFKCSNSLLGKNISIITDPDPFIEVKENENKKVEFTKSYPNYNLTCHHILYKLNGVKQFAGIFVDITKSVANTEKLDKLRYETILQAEELMNHQIEMAQKLTKFLGESTAKGEELVDNLMKLTADHDKNNKTTRNGWLWDIYTSK